MDAYMAAAAKGNISDAECSQRLKSEDIAQVKDFCQNSAHLNQTSFIPVYSNKTVCHKFPKNECENPCSERKVLATYSPPTRPRCITGSSDMIAARVTKTHMRRRSVGFEDMTSLSSCYGHNFTNDRMVYDRRFQSPFHNSNIPQSATENHSNFMNSDNVLPMKKANSSENRCFSPINQNSQLSSGENANDNQQRRTDRSLQRYKDKSSKRKSSLNRMDFIHLPSSNNGSSQFYSEAPVQKNNSSSDEGSESRFRPKKSESPCSTSKRKHYASSALPKFEMKTNETTLSTNSPTKVKSNLLPRSSHMKHLNPRQIRWKQTAAIRFSQKLSHSAGELESLTDFSEVPNRNKTCLSAQEFDDLECSAIPMKSNSGRVMARNSSQKLSPRHLSRNEHLPSISICDNASQANIKNESVNDSECNILAKHNESDDLDITNIDSNNSQLVDQKENIISDGHSEQNNGATDSVNLGLKLDCDDSIEYIDAEVNISAVQLENLEITDDESKVVEIYLSADESGEMIGSDGERRPSSILRKKSFEEKKELHSILKPPPEDKTSKTPPSILKNRESSEEKDSWQLNDLHSILKKSTSEDESCNSGPDIRPILKLSTDEDSPSGAVRPHPILKKRTSFSDECSYVSFPSGELKPILKKKTPISSEEQPKPILKSRRKSEDTRSMSEVITSRPRAYSADMGVKMSHESQNEGLDVKKDQHKFDSHDL